MSDLLSTLFLASLVSGGVLVAVPLVFAGVGEAISERAGVLNVGLDDVDGCLRGICHSNQP